MCTGILTLQALPRSVEAYCTIRRGNLESALSERTAAEEIDVGVHLGAAEDTHQVSVDLSSWLEAVDMRQAGVEGRRHITSVGSRTMECAVCWCFARLVEHMVGYQVGVGTVQIDPVAAASFGY